MALSVRINFKNHTFRVLNRTKEHFKKMPSPTLTLQEESICHAIYSLFQAIRMNKRRVFVPIVLFFKYFCKYEGIFLSHTRHSTHSATD